MHSITALAWLAMAADVGNEMPKEAKEAFQKAAEFDLYSLDPSPEGRNEKSPERFHGWTVFGKTTLKSDAAKTIHDAIEKGRKDSDGKVAACFNPRHGVRIVQDQKTYDLVICFECLSAEVYESDKQIGSFLTTSTPAKVLNKALTDAKVPLPKQKE
jgi:hypothetical protein